MANQPNEDQKEPLSQESVKALKLISGDLESHNDDPETSEAIQAPGPLSVELNGKTFDSPEDFRAHYKETVDTTNEEGAEEAKALRTQYAQIFQGKMEMIKSRIREAEKSIKKTFKFKRDPNNKKTKMGVIDILQSFLDEGLLVREKSGQFVTPEGLTLAGSLANVANEQIALISKINHIRYREINGFAHFDKNAGFVYQLGDNEKHEVTGGPAFKVYNLITVYGKPSIEEKTYAEHEVPNMIQLDIATMKIRKEERKKEQEKRKKKSAKKNKKGAAEQAKPKSQPKAEEKVEAKKPKSTMNEDVKVLSDAIKENPEELKIINQTMGAMLHHQDRVAGAQVTEEQLELMMRKAVDHIDEDGVDIRDGLSEEEQKELFVDTPKRLSDLVKMSLSTDALPAIAQSLREQLEKIKVSQASEESSETAEVIELSGEEESQENTDSESDVA